MIDVTVVTLESGLPSTVVAPVEIFSGTGVLWGMLHGETVEPPFRVQTASIDGRATCGRVPLLLQPTCSIDEIEHTDLIVIGACGADLDVAAKRDARVVEWLKMWRARGAALAAVCSGVAIIAETGLLDGGHATTHWAFADEFRRRYPRVRWLPERFVTECDNIFSSGGVYSSVDLSLYLVEKYCGHQVAMQTARALLLETPRAWQTGYAAEPPHATHEDAQISDAQEWLFRNFRQAVRVEDLAMRVAMSPRTFARRFKGATGDTPIEYLHRVRINAARHLLESESRSVRQVSRAVGYEDIAFFRRLFRRYTGDVPRAYRERFGTRPAANVAMAGRAPHH